MDINPDLVGPGTPVGTKEICVLLGVAEGTVKYWRAEPSRLFPPPASTPCHGRPWWRWADIDDWNRTMRRRSAVNLNIADAVNTGRAS